MLIVDNDYNASRFWMTTDLHGPLYSIFSYLQKSISVHAGFILLNQPSGNITPFYTPDAMTLR